MAKAQEKYQFLPESWLNQLQNAHFDAVAELAEAIVLQITGQPPFNKDSHPKAPCPSGQPLGISLLLLYSASNSWAPYSSRWPPQEYPTVWVLKPATFRPPGLVDSHLRISQQLLGPTC